MASENLSKPYIQAAIAEARKAQQERTQVDADRVVTEAWNIVPADSRELVQVKVGCCRHCWGEGFRYQRTVGEFNHDREQHALKNAAPAEFDEKGGIGFDPLKPPHPACPDCGGDGHPRTVLADTRRLSPRAVALYAGAKMTKYGIEISMRDKGAAMEKLFKHLGPTRRTTNRRATRLRPCCTASRTAMAMGSGPWSMTRRRPRRRPAPTASCRARTSTMTVQAKAAAQQSARFEVKRDVQLTDQ
jgi:phage terminase small subunit